jgi:hypothetical protein
MPQLLQVSSSGGNRNDDRNNGRLLAKSSDASNDAPRRRSSDAAPLIGTGSNRAQSRDSLSSAAAARGREGGERSAAKEDATAVIDLNALPPTLRSALVRARAEPACDDCNWQVLNPMRLVHENCDRASAHRMVLRRLDWLNSAARRALTGRASSDANDLFVVPEERGDRVRQLMILHSIAPCDSCQFRPNQRGSARHCDDAVAHKAARAKYEWLQQNVLMMPISIKSNVGSFVTEMRPLATLADVRAQLAAQTNRVAEKITAGDRNPRDDSVDLLTLIKHTPELTVRFGDFMPIAKDQPVDCSRCRRRNKAEALFCDHCKVLLPEHLIKSRYVEPTDKAAAAELCTFCQDDITTGAVVSVLPCLHVFHFDCIVSWLRVHSFCPTCKIAITKENMSIQ